MELVTSRNYQIKSFAKNRILIVELGAFPPSPVAPPPRRASDQGEQGNRTPAPTAPFPLLSGSRRDSEPSAQRRHRPVTAPRRGQADPGRLRPSCGQGSTPQASPLLFPLPQSRPEPLAAGIGTTGELPPPPLFPSAGEGRR